MVTTLDPNAREDWNLVIFFDNMPKETDSLGYPIISEYLMKSWQKLFYLIGVDPSVPYEVNELNTE